MQNKNYKNFLLNRPVVDGMKLDENKMPIIRAAKIKDYRTNTIKLTNFKNIKSVKNRNTTIIDMFNYDDVLEAIWRDPLKYISKFEGFLAVASPDFSTYLNMNELEINHNVFKSRYTGSLWQCFGLDNVIATISWAHADTYDVCFSGIERGSAVIISTLGACKNKTAFIDGFNEMKKRLEPELIIVVGKLFDEMEGKFLHFALDETFTQNPKNEQLSLFHLSNYLEIRNGVRTYGW